MVICLSSNREVKQELPPVSRCLSQSLSFYTSLGLHLFLSRSLSGSHVASCLPLPLSLFPLSLRAQVQKLQSILKPMMLRRLKEDVEKNLAPKQETIIEVSVRKSALK